MNHDAIRAERLAKSRAEFEAFQGRRRGRGEADRIRIFARREDGSYREESTQRHWWTWQNARGEA